ncbi:MbcA/ParS/Xre antitoxin family protein [Chitinimonas viridis]|uniref:MbcA/ParS/Xre antitoxin family protein n=1 Tax=Chitinimonas viridis TaxID=664880 RepID=A0ABT8B7Y8_9NEIS|nr:MbcA/ParS/Xre antitoxin family protein [Chitinimonas viridis]MDN3578271.1 MbcA/ParS/Xre antitoxin family protein [Chitinimonas viridis]
MDKSDYEEANTLPLSVYAARVFGDEGKARAWMSSHNSALGAVPADLVAQPEGERGVRAILLKIEHGLAV